MQAGPGARGSPMPYDARAHLRLASWPIRDSCEDAQCIIDRRRIREFLGYR
jgi:hypothetical protein